MRAASALVPALASASKRSACVPMGVNAACTNACATALGATLCGVTIEWKAFREERATVPQSRSIGAPAAMRSSKSVARLFGDLKVRPKLMVLHNLFFTILVLSVYFALYP